MSGMYRMDEFVAGSYYTLVPNEYWDGPKPKIEKIVINFVADPVTAAQADLVDMTNTNNNGDAALQRSGGMADRDRQNGSARPAGSRRSDLARGSGEKRPHYCDEGNDGFGMGAPGREVARHSSKSLGFSPSNNREG